MSIASRIEAIEQHLTDDYSVLTLAGADLTNVDKNILNLKPTWKERLLYFMNNGTDVVWNNWDKVTGEGTSISLNNTLEGKMKINLKGNTSQEGTPTPETPQDIHVVSGDNSIVVGNGKNIFNMKEYASANSSYFTYSSSTGLTAIAKDNRATANVGYPIEVDTNTTYYIKTDTDKRLLIAQFNSNNVWITNNEVFNGGSFKPNANASYIRVKVADTLTSFPTVVGNVYISTSSDYTEESYPITLPEGMFLGWIPNTDYRDIIFQAKTGDTYYDSLDSTTKESLTYGKWYLNKQIGKVVLDGSSDENYSFNSGTTQFYMTKTNFDTITEPRKLSTNALSNYYGFANSWTLNKFSFSGTGALQIWIDDSSITSTALWKTWLSTHNTTVYYVLNTPTYTEITDSTLISQLNALAKSYEGQTNISQENNDLASLLNATALREMA